MLHTVRFCVLVALACFMVVRVCARHCHHKNVVNERYPHAVLFAGTCGGTIISPEWILTAAHCIIPTKNGPFTSNLKERFVIAGTNRTDDDSGVIRKVKRFVIHPKFSVGPYWFTDEFHYEQVAVRWDFLLVELSEPLPLDGITMKAATLNGQSEFPAFFKVKYAGYGAEHIKGEMSNIMHSYKLTLQTDEMCSSLEQYDAKDMLCARGPSAQSCKGDSGSGLVDSNGLLVGVLSWAEKDVLECRSGNLVFFSRVGAVRDWIRQVTQIESISSEKPGSWPSSSLSPASHSTRKWISPPSSVDWTEYWYD